MKFPATLLITLFSPVAVFGADGDKPAPPKAAKGQPEKAPAAAAAPPAAAAADAKPPVDPTKPVPVKFIPAKPGKGKGASGTDLSRKSFDPDARTAMISIGLGDSFPVMDEQGHQLFMLHMTAGDDQTLVFEVQSKDAKQKEAVEKIAVVRDGVTDVTVNGVKYEVVYPTMSVNPTDNAITHEPTIFVKQRP